MNNQCSAIIAPLVLSFSFALCLPRTACGQSFTVPERLGIIDVIPNDQSGENTQDAEPSLGLGLGTNFGKLVLAVDGPSGIHTLFTSTDSGFLWTYRGTFPVGDATVDWSAGGNAYRATLPITLPHITDIELEISPDPTAGISFSTSEYLHTPAATDQPNLTVVNAGGLDQIYIGYGSYNFSPHVAAVHFSLNGGSTWN